jgi:Eukaryotic cytochrome b561
MLLWLAIVVSFCGLYVIYTNKENFGKQHLQSNHAYAGLFVMVNFIGLGFVGGLVLHPDFGFDKSNTTIRLAHKMAGRIVLIMAWMNAFVGLYQMNAPPTTLLMYGIPLVLLMPFSLM